MSRRYPLCGCGFPNCFDNYPWLNQNQDQAPAQLTPRRRFIPGTWVESEAQRHPRPRSMTSSPPEIPDIEDLVPARPNAPPRSAVEAEHPPSRVGRVVAELPFGRQRTVQSVAEASHMPRLTAETSNPPPRPRSRISQQIGQWVRIMRRPGTEPSSQGEDVVGRFASHAEMYEEAPESAEQLPIQATMTNDLSPMPVNITTHFELMNYLRRNPRVVAYPHFHPHPNTKRLKEINIQPWKEVLRISKLPGGSLYTPSEGATAYVRPEPLEEFSEGLDRLRSFKGWRWWNAMPSRLAFAGFVYRGNGDKIECFCCRMKIENFYCDPKANWDPVVLHLNHAREYCSHLDSILGEKKTLVEGHWFDKNTVQGNFPHSQHNLVIYGNGGPKHKNLTDIAKRSDKFWQNKYDPIDREIQRGGDEGRRLAQLGFFSKHKYPTNWELAEAGFFCENRIRVCCYYCGMGVEMWPVHLEDSSPTAVHDLYFPQCFLSQIRNLPAPKPLQFVSGPVPEDGELMEQDGEDERERMDHSRPECKLCLLNEGNILSITCGHVLGCAECVQKIKNLQCPFCRTGINAIMTIYT